MNIEKINPTTGINTAMEKMTRVAITPVAISLETPLCDGNGAIRFSWILASLFSYMNLADYRSWVPT